MNNPGIMLPLLLVSAMAFSTTSMSQHAQKLYGSIADSATKKPLDGVTVHLLDSLGNTLQTGLTGADGSFSFPDLAPGRHELKITAIGYRVKRVNVDAGIKGKSNYAEAIFLSRSMSELNEVVVVASKPLIRQEIDKITYDLQADPESKGSSVLEMMRKVPFLSVDGDNNILLNGSAAYRIFINGRPSALVERNPKDVLRSMPASTIKSIEVITNPSSKYDAEGLAGIINIITYKKLDNGYNGTVNISHRFPVGGPGAGGSLSFRSGRLGVSVLGGGAIYHSPVTRGWNHRTAFGTDTTNLDQYFRRSSDGRNAYLASEISYEFDSLHLVSAQFNMNGSRTNGVADQHSVLAGEGKLIQGYDLRNNEAANGNGVDAALNYQMGFRSARERLLTFSYRFLKNTNRQYDGVAVSMPVNFDNPDYHQVDHGSFSEHTLQIDHVHAVRKWNIELGVKGILRENESGYRFLFYDSLSGSFRQDIGRSNHFHDHQEIFAAYNTWQYKMNNWGFKLGARVEQTITDAGFSSGNARVKQDYLNIVPAAAINVKIKNNSSLGIAYTNRIQRPAIYQLNPFVDRSNPTIESSGNPDLRPGFANIIQISYTRSKKGVLNISLACMFFDDLINPVSAYYPAAHITRIRFENLGHARILKTNIFFNYPVTKRMDIRFNSDIRYIAARFSEGGRMLKNGGVMEYFYISGSYRFGKGWRLNADLTLKSGGMSTMQATSNGFIGSSWSVQKNFVHDRLTFSGTVSNPFTKYRQVTDEVIASDFAQLTKTETYYRSFNISLNYRFGKLKATIKKNKRGINNDDVELK